MINRKLAFGAVLVFIGPLVVFVLRVPVPAHDLNQTNGMIVSSGQKREYLLYVPRSYDHAKPTPLVICLHGAALSPAAQMEISQWNKVADEHGFIVVYPSGTGFPRYWPTGPGSLESNVRFISDLISKLEATYSIDPARIYANGLSNGGEMTFALSCTMSNRIAAVGTVAAAQLLPFDWCKDSRPVPMISFHGTADRFAPYKGGSSSFAPEIFPNVRTWTANWARRNRCGPNPVDSVAASDVTRLEYLNCAEDAAVVLYTIQGGGHTWPGGEPAPGLFVGSTTRSINASSLMWAFFRKHPLPRE